MKPDYAREANDLHRRAVVLPTDMGRAEIQLALEAAYRQGQEDDLSDEVRTAIVRDRMYRHAQELDDLSERLAEVTRTLRDGEEHD